MLPQRYDHVFLIRRKTNPVWVEKAVKLNNNDKDMQSFHRDKPMIRLQFETLYCSLRRNESAAM